MKKNDYIFLAILIIVYCILLRLFQPEILSKRFDKELIPLYMRSQDIPHEVPGRVFLSDSEIHIAAGYLYARGEDPTVYNFQHPPFLKYMYGWSILLWNNPFIVQILFGSWLLIATYFFGKKIFKESMFAALGCVLLVTDPLFINVSTQALLDLGQTLLGMLYLYFVLFYKKKWIWHGVILGLLAASKFWSTSIFFILFAFALEFFVQKEKIDVKRQIKSFIVAFITFSLVYLQSFIARGGMFNIIFFQLKMLKYWFHHSVTSIPFASVILFVTGYFKTWWDGKEFIRAEPWSILWPVGFISSFIGVWNWKKVKEKSIVFIIPLLFLLYLGVQAPFPRYFIMILPYMYLGMSYGIVSVGRKLLKK